MGSARVEECNDSYRNPRVLDRSPHSLWTWMKCLVIGIETLPFLYFASTSLFHTIWFYVCACAFIWYPHLLEWINLMRMNVANNMIVGYFVDEFDKKWGRKISQYELQTCHMTTSQLPQCETMRRLNLIKLWLERLICIGWTIFVLLLCIVNVFEYESHFHEFGFVWAIAYIAVSFCIFIYCFCKCATKRPA